MALSAEKKRYQRDLGVKRLGSGTGADSQTVYGGAIVCHNGAGKIAVGADTSGFYAAGVASKDQSTGSSNTDAIGYEWGQVEWFAMNGTDLVAADIGKNAVIKDDGVLTEASVASNDVVLGQITELETLAGVSGAWVAVGIFSLATA